MGVWSRVYAQAEVFMRLVELLLLDQGAWGPTPQAAEVTWRILLAIAHEPPKVRCVHIRHLVLVGRSESKVLLREGA
jgi:transposase